MDLYDQVSIETAGIVTKRYSTSFSLACRLFPRDLRNSIYSIYGLVRVADEIVDTYAGPGARKLLDSLEAETEAALELGYSANPIVHAFARTAREFGISPDLTKPFFASMRQDLTKQHYTKAMLDEYIYGSAEVVGLMCLRVFTRGNQAEYERLLPGARSLGAAFQKVNFLRDLGSDEASLGRIYFPQLVDGQLDEVAKSAIEADIAADFEAARKAIILLPPAARPAVQLAYVYYIELFHRIQATSPHNLRTIRVRVSNPVKIWLFVRVALASVFRPRGLA